MANISGTTGNDTLIGSNDSDFLSGNSGDDSIVGAGGNDTIFGDGGNDWVEGGAGNDSISGGGGQDTIVFREFGAANADVVSSFATAWDRIQLDLAAFSAIGASGRFAAGDARFYSAAGASGGHDADDRIIYNSSTGQLYYDADGNGAGTAQLIATLQGAPALTASDINVFGTASQPGVINGTNGDDTLIGTAGPDTINGLGGNDSIVGGAGADSMSGGDGNDVLDGFNRPTNGPSTGYNDVDVDTMAGGFGNDTFNVDNANDVLVDAGGIDTVVARNVHWTLGSGFENLTVLVDDEFGGGTGNELDNVIDGTHAYKAHFEGLGGNDLILGGGKGSLLGGEGNDTLVGDGLDTLDGGNGNDMLIASLGDVLTGGAGADAFVFGRAGASIGSSDLMDFVSGTDRIQLNAEVMTALGASGTFSANDPRFYAAAGATSGHDADDRVIFDTNGQLYYDPDGSGPQSSFLIASTFGAQIAATDITVINGTGSGQVINGTAGNDSLVGTAADDTINGFGGNDTIDGAGGNDSMVGGDGDDVYYVNDFADIVVETQNGGIDEVRATFWYTLPDWVNNLTLLPSAANGTGNDIDNVIVGNDQYNFINGLGGNDSLVGGAGNDTLDGGAGNDTLNGGVGDDTYRNVDGGDTIVDAGGTDTMEFRGPGSSFSLRPGIENLTIVQASGEQPQGGADAFGNELNNVIRIESPGGWNYVHAGDGNDTLIGGSGFEDFVFGSLNTGNYGNDVVDGGGSGFDAVDFAPANGAVAIDFRAGTASGGGGSVSFVNVEIGSGGSFNDTLIADDAGRELLGRGGNDTLTGGAGDDTLFGDGFFGDAPTPPLQHGNDLLIGGAGNDVMSGGGQSDTLNGGLGNDNLSGDSGDAPNGPDHFIFDVAPGSANADIINGFESGSDKIHLDARVMTALGGSGNFAVGDARFYAAAGATGGHDADDRVLYDSSTGNIWYDADGSGAGSAQLIATLNLNPNFPTPTLVASDIVVDNGGTPTPTPTPGQNIQGTTGNDSLVGGAGNDTIYGNAGNDTIEGMGGNDSVSGGGGQDVYVFHEYGAANADTVTSFDTGWDALRLDGAAFNTLGASGRFSGGDVRFYAAPGATSAHDADDLIVYNTSTGQLFYDNDASGPHASQLIATFQGAPTIVASDITAFNTPTPVPTPTPTPGAINGTDGNDSLVGTAGDDTINGFGGNDTIDGLAGADSMVGGAGDDLYFVDNLGDVIVEAQNGGIDEVREALNNYTLPAWVNNLTLLGTAAVGQGNDIDNVIVGNASANSLHGYGGNDSLVGGAGDDSLWGAADNDTLVGGDGNDLLGGDEGNDSMSGGAGLDNFYFQITAGGDYGNDTVDGGDNSDWMSFSGGGLRSGIVADMRTGTVVGGGLNGVGSVSFTSIENIQGSFLDDRITGDNGSNWLTGGGGGADTLNGSLGTDMLTGGVGADHFVFDVSPGGSNYDVITDFASGEDKISLDARAMSALGASGNFAVDDARFYAAAGATGGHDADDRVIFNTSTGQLFYDADGSGVSTGQLLFTVQSGAAVAATDIVVDNGTTPPPTTGQNIQGSTAADTLVGGSGNDTIYGNAGNDWIEGRGGNDIVSGGGGQDSYVFREYGAADADTVTSFDTAWDAMRFDSAAFTGAGGVGHFATGDARFYAAAGASSGHDADDRFVYNTSTGQLYYDADGAGGNDAQLVATVQGAPTVTANDIWII